MLVFRNRMKSDTNAHLGILALIGFLSFITISSIIVLYYNNNIQIFEASIKEGKSARQPLTSTISSTADSNEQTTATKLGDILDQLKDFDKVEQGSITTREHLLSPSQDSQSSMSTDSLTSLNTDSMTSSSQSQEKTVTFGNIVYIYDNVFIFEYHDNWRNFFYKTYAFKLGWKKIFEEMSWLIQNNMQPTHKFAESVRKFYKKQFKQVPNDDYWYTTLMICTNDAYYVIYAKWIDKIQPMIKIDKRIMHQLYPNMKENLNFCQGLLINNH